MGQSVPLGQSRCQGMSEPLVQGWRCRVTLPSPGRSRQELGHSHEQPPGARGALQEQQQSRCALHRGIDPGSVPHGVSDVLAGVGTALPLMCVTDPPLCVQEIPQNSWSQYKTHNMGKKVRLDNMKRGTARGHSSPCSTIDKSAPAAP